MTEHISAVGIEGEPMTSTAAVFVTDRGFLVPSLIAARKLVKFRINKYCDIFIYLIDDDKELIKRINCDFGKYISVVHLDDNTFIPKNSELFFKNHVPYSTLARLTIGKFIDKQYKNIVYLDGDIQIIQDPLPLFQTPVPDGYICAAPGAAWINELENIPQYDNIIELGISPITYFNAGILAFNRSTWLEKSSEALEFYMNNMQKCRVHDQSALNYVFKGKVKPLSPLFNFHHVYFEARAHEYISPYIIHFTGSAKPWSGFPFPWFACFRSEYKEFLDQYSYLQGTIRLSRLFGKAHLAARSRAVKEFYLKRRALMNRRRKAIIERVRDEFFIS